MSKLSGDERGQELLTAKFAKLREGREEALTGFSSRTLRDLCDLCALCG